jgi:hypothetical protein
MNNITTTEDQTQKSVWSYLISIIDRPQATFEALAANPRWKWILPLVFACVIAVILIWVTAPYTSEYGDQATRQQLAERGMSAEEIEEVMADTAQFRSPMFIGIAGSISGVVILGIIWVVTAALFYFVSLIAGAELKFGSVFVVVAWSTLPLTIRSLVHTIWIALTQKFPVYNGLAALQTTGDQLKDAANPMVALLSFVDIFWIWHIILLVIGLAVAAKFSRTKAFFIVLLYAALSIGLTVGLTLMGVAG